MASPLYLCSLQGLARQGVRRDVCHTSDVPCLHQAISPPMTSLEKIFLQITSYIQQICWTNCAVLAFSRCFSSSQMTSAKISLSLQKMAKKTPRSGSDQMLILSSLLAGNWFALKDFFDMVEWWRSLEASKTYIFASVVDIGAGILYTCVDLPCIFKFRRVISHYSSVQCDASFKM